MICDGATVVVDSPPRPESVVLLRRLEPDAVVLAAEDARAGGTLTGVLPADLPAPVVLVTGAATAGALEPARIVGVMGLLLRPLRRVLADRPVVEAAKARLMTRDGLSEAAAFGWLRRRAMEQRMRMGEVARAVLACDA